MEKYKDFTRLFPVQKTLRMGLVPVGRTLDNIQRNEVLQGDEQLASNFSLVKPLLDKYHKNIIEVVLDGLTLDNGLLAEYAALLEHKHEKGVDKSIAKIQDTLCSYIAKAFAAYPDFHKLWKKEMFTELMPAFLQDADERNAVATFANHVGYFTDYNNVRKNIYDAKSRNGAVAARIVCDNFPLFVYNCKIINKILQNPVYAGLRDDMAIIYSSFEEYLNVGCLEEMFQIRYFTRMLCQSQLDVYNMILGGKTVSPEAKLKGLNECINIFNSRNPKELRLPKLMKMKKMILSDKVVLSWLPEKFESDNALLEAMAEAKDDFYIHAFGQEGLMHLVGELASFDWKGIYIHKKNINNLSNMVFGKWSLMAAALIDVEKRNVRRTRRMTDDDVMVKAESLYKKHNSFSIRQIVDAIMDYDEAAGKTFTDWLAKGRENAAFVRFKTAAHKAGEVLDYVYPQHKSLMNDTKAVALIKDLADAMIALKNLSRLFMMDGSEQEMDSSFYDRLLPLYENLSNINTLYNMVRNYLTRKPYSGDKMKLNFNYINFMSGWDSDKVREYGSMLLRKDGAVYLAVLQKGLKLSLDDWETTGEGGCYERVCYKQMVGAFKMLPKMFFSDKWMREGKCIPGDDIIRGYAARRHLKGDTFDLDFCHRLIDYFKHCCMLVPAWQCYHLKFSDTSTYQDISQFYNELEKQTYSISFRPLSAAVVDECVEQGQIYLFRIHNRDLSAYSKGKKQLQTLYYQMLLDERNLNDLVIKLNGGAEMYFRKASIKPGKPTHPAGVPMANKNPLSSRKEAVFDYPLIKDNRYTKDTFHFHFPVTINCNSSSFANVNQMANKFIRKTEDLHIIGINRGERNLIYLTVINPQGQIVEQFSLNVIVNENLKGKYRTDYHELLTRRENERAEARESWMTVKNISDLKEGYLSAALHKVVGLLGKYNAVIAIEELDKHFKNSRKHIEHEIYSKFEDMLINKLNYLTDKSRDVLETGGILRGIQLTGKADEMGDYTRQNGIVFRVPTWYIGMTCPVTGFINFLKPKYTNIKEAREFFGKMDDIRYNADKSWFEFDIDYDNFTDKAAEGRKRWTVCTAGSRIYKGKPVELTPEMLNLFNRYGIQVGADLKEQIVEHDSREFFESLMQLFSLALQMRNMAEGIDYLVSPVKDKDGGVFVSAKDNTGLPGCVDANDAFNIARKGLMFVRQIRQSTDDWVKLAVSNAEWMQFVQQ